MMHTKHSHHEDDAVVSCPLYPEEKLADYAMNRLSEADRSAVERHLRHCEACARTAAEWQAILGEAGGFSGGLVQEASEGEIPGGFDAEPAFSTGKASDRTEPKPEPSQRLRKRLMRAAYARSLRKRAAANRRYALQAIAGAALLALFVGLFASKGAAGKEETFDHAVNQRIAHMQSADTERYAIQPVEPFYGSGSVWLKRGSGEMLIVVNGLYSLKEKDYQVWLQDEDQLSSAGFMLVQGTQGRSYYYGFGAKKAKRIVVSMEPKGGSLRPTGPEAVLVDFEQE
ncbi:MULTISPECIES: anti-sigma factor domain-containing protein [Paenibacillus]|uniref:anti-sigma factor domain-containing protein n=1 Tax=Paenibacillus TaxID=44249 RepID=UPI0004917508|nr:anti-sigma factor [Paenibacillus sp. IHBB 10380]